MLQQAALQDKIMIELYEEGPYLHPHCKHVGREALIPPTSGCKAGESVLHDDFNLLRNLKCHFSLAEEERVADVAKAAQVPAQSVWLKGSYP